MGRYRLGIGVAALALMGVTGCATKNYVRTQTAPLAEQTTQLEDKSADNNRQIKDVDSRAQPASRRRRARRTPPTRTRKTPVNRPARRKPRPTTP